MNKTNTIETKPLVAECANLRLSASEASGTATDPWDFVMRAKNSCKQDANLQNCGIWVGGTGIEPVTSTMSM